MGSLAGICLDRIQATPTPSDERLPVLPPSTAGRLWPALSVSAAQWEQVEQSLPFRLAARRRPPALRRWPRVPCRKGSTAPSGLVVSEKCCVRSRLQACLPVLHIGSSTPTPTGSASSVPGDFVIPRSVASTSAGVTRDTTTKARRGPGRAARCCCLGSDGRRAGRHQRGHPRSSPTNSTWATACGRLPALPADACRPPPGPPPSSRPMTTSAAGWTTARNRPRPLRRRAPSGSLP